MLLCKSDEKECRFEENKRIDLIFSLAVNKYTAGSYASWLGRQGGRWGF